jgi:ribosome modulation factor
MPQNTQQPIISPVRQQGRDAYFAGVVVGNCPYDEYDPLHWEWLQGWAEAGMAVMIAKNRNMEIAVNDNPTTFCGTHKGV